MTSTWRNDKKIVEGAEFAIFDNSYWKGKEQLGPTMPNQLSNSLENLRKYLNYPLLLIDKTMNEVIFSCLKVLTDYPNCDTNTIPTNPQTLAIDPNLLWLSESFQSTIIEELTEKKIAGRTIKGNRKNAVKPNEKPKRKKREKFTLMEGFKVDNTNLLSIQQLQQLISKYQTNHPFMTDNDIYYSTRNKVATYYIQQVKK